MAELPITTGQVDFNAPGTDKPCTTWYKIVGDLDQPGSPAPLIALHGGPGAGHEYLSSVTDLYEKHGIPIIFYDQIGCGRSTHLRDKMGDASFWTVDLFIQELDNLIDHLKLREKGFFVMGQSWGGMLTGAYASRQPKGLRKAVIVSGPASVPVYVEGCRGLLAKLPPDVQKTIEECERNGDYESETYEKAAAHFYRSHVCRLDPYPDDIMEGFKNLKEDPTSYLTM